MVSIKVNETYASSETIESGSPFSSTLQSLNVAVYSPVGAVGSN